MDGNEFYVQKSNHNKRKPVANKILICIGCIILFLSVLWILNISGVIIVKDYTAPTIYLNGKTTVSLVIGESYNDSNIKAIDNKDGDITSKVIKTGTVDTSKPGVYVVTYTVEDKAGNKGKINRIITVVEDNVGPKVEFNPNGNNSEEESYITKVNVSDPSGIKMSKYEWTTSLEIPISSSFNMDFTSDSNIKTPNNKTGDYYLWIYSIDSKDNTTIEHSNVFKIKHNDETSNDIIPPKVTFEPNGNNDLLVTQNAKVTLDDESGIKVSKYQWTTSTIAPSFSDSDTSFTSGQTISSPANVTGTYYLWIYAEDALGNSNTISSSAYKIRQLSTDGTLSKLSIDGATFTFNKNTYSYVSSTDVGYNVSSVNISATSTDSNATVSGIGNHSLVVGANVIKILVTAEDKKTTKTYDVTLTRRDNGSRIHFINNGVISSSSGRSDSILLESNGYYALIDSSYVAPINYLKKVGAKTLEFVVATHSHFDHIQGMPDIFNNFTVKTLYTKIYDPRIEDFANDPKSHYDNGNDKMKTLYNTMITAANSKQIAVVSDQICSSKTNEHSNCDPEGSGLIVIPTKYGNTKIPDSVTLGNLTIKFFNKDNTSLKPGCFDPNNTQYYHKCISQNTVSIGEKVSYNLGTSSAFFAADIDYNHAESFIDNKDVETRIAPLIGTVNLLKVGHHGDGDTTNDTFASYLKPSIVVYTKNTCNTYPKINGNYVSMLTINNLYKYNSNAVQYVDGLSNGADAIIATFTSSNISLTNLTDWNTAKCIKSKDSNINSPWPSN